MDRSKIPPTEEVAARFFLGLGLTDNFNLEELKRALGIALKQYGIHCDSPGNADTAILQKYTKAFYQAYRILKFFTEPSAKADDNFVAGFPFLDKKEMDREPKFEQQLADFLKEL